MCILVDGETRVIVQGITGTVGSFQSKVMLDYGTNVVAGVTPGKGGESVHGIPVYDLVQEAVDAHGGDVVLSFVPGPFSADAALESIQAGLKLVIMTAEGVPLHDVMRVMRLADEKSAIIAGRMKAENKISYADAYVVATALDKNAKIITGDKEFKSVEDIVAIDWLPRNH